METMRIQVDTDRGRKVRLLGWFYECVFCWFYQRSWWMRCVCGRLCIQPRPRLVCRLIGHWFGIPRWLCFHSIVPFSAPAFSRCAQLFHIFPPQQAAAGLSLEAPASGQQAFRDFSLLAGDFILLCFSLEPSGQSLFNVMAVYLTKSRRSGQF